MSRVDTSGLGREAVLAALYNAASPRGLGFLQYDPLPMDVAGAKRVIEVRGNDLFHVLHKLSPSVFPVPPPRTTLAFDYVYGRPLKVILVNPLIDVAVYEGIHGEGMARTALDILRGTGDPMHDDIMSLHHTNVRTAALQEWNGLPPAYRDEVLRLHRAGSRSADSLDGVIAGILFPTVN